MDRKENSTMKSLSIPEKIKLTKWMMDNKELCEKSHSEAIRSNFFNETGIDTSLSTINAYRNEICPKIIKHIPGGKLNGGRMMSMIKQLEERVTKLEDIITA